MTLIERVRELLDYDPEIGVFTWKVDRNGTVRAGSVAGSVDVKGYMVIKVDRRTFKAHRLALMHVHGVMPKDDIDHINGDRLDNRIANLRAATKSLNQQNRGGSRVDSVTGVLGVSPQRGQWRAQIMVRGRKVNLGDYDDIDEATQARVAAELALGWPQGRRCDLPEIDPGIASDIRRMLGRRGMLDEAEDM